MRASVGLALLIAVGCAQAAVTIQFEYLPDGTALGSDVLITTQYQLSHGVTFSGGSAMRPGGIVLESGITLNESDFPPLSGTHVLSDTEGPITGEFDSPMKSIEAYFTYVTPVTLTAWDKFGNPTSIRSSYTENYANSLYPSPNEFIGLSSKDGFVSFRIEGDPLGNSFVLDDFTFDSVQSATAVPEASGIWSGAVLALIGACKFFGVGGFKRH